MAIDNTIRYRSVTYIPDYTEASFYASIDHIFRRYNVGGWTIATIYCDRAFTSLMSTVEQQVYTT